LRESEEVVQQVQNKEYALWDGTITITVYNCLYPAADLFPSPTLTVGTFEESETFGEE
jgi:hypothetical protein